MSRGQYAPGSAVCIRVQCRPDGVRRLEVARIVLDVEATLVDKAEQGVELDKQRSCTVPIS